MKKFILLFPLLLFVPTVPPASSDDKPVKKDPPAPAAPYVKLPATKTGSPERNVYLVPDTNCAPPLKWVIPTGLTQDTEVQLKHPLAIAVYGDTGTYLVQCYGALNNQASDIAACTVTIGTPAPPVPPVPPNPLTAALQAGYALDVDSDKATSLALLKKLYAAMAQEAPTWGVQTVSDAVANQVAVIQAPAPAGLTLTQVVNLRKAIMTNFTTTFGTVGTKPIVVADFVTWLNNVSSALAGVK